MTIIAVDPGMRGAIVIDDGISLSIHHIEDGEDETLQFLYPYSRNSYVTCFMEKVGGYIPKEDADGNAQGQPGSRMFSFGDSYGFVRGLLKALQIKTVLVLPQQWQKGIPGRDGSYSKRKAALHVHAKRLFPEMDVKRTEADALGLLHYARSVISLKTDAKRAVSAVSSADRLTEVEAWAQKSGFAVPRRGTSEHVAMMKWHRKNFKK